MPTCLLSRSDTMIWDLNSQRKSSEVFFYLSRNHRTHPRRKEKARRNARKRHLSQSGRILEKQQSRIRKRRRRMAMHHREKPCSYTQLWSPHADFLRPPRVRILNSGLQVWMNPQYNDPLFCITSNPINTSFY